jgi:hypothetical protein
MDKLRCYHFNNFYFSGIQAGIQSHHSFMEIYNKYKNDRDSTQFNMMDEWAENNKTVIVLNGGMQSDIEEMEAFLDNKNNNYPWASFREAKEASNGTLTNAGIILPDTIFKMSRLISSNHPKILASRGIGDGRKFDNGELQILVVDEGVLVEFNPKMDNFSLVKPILEAPFQTEFSLKTRLYSNFEVELMARLSLFSLAA